MEYSVEEARSIFMNDRYAMDTTGIDILEVADGYAKCCFKLEDKHRNALGSVMGGALFTLADFVFAVATNYNKPYSTVTSVSSISYLRGCRDGMIYAESRKIHNGRVSCTYEVDIKSGEGKLLAVENIHGIHIPKDK